MLQTTEIFSKRRKIHSCNWTEARVLGNRCHVNWMTTGAIAFVYYIYYYDHPKGWKRAVSRGNAILDRLLTGRTASCLNCQSRDKKSFDHGRDAWSLSKRSNFEEQILHLILAQWAEKRCRSLLGISIEQKKEIKNLCAHKYNK